MITEQDLREAIAECEGARNPNASTCIRLAAYYTILNNMTGGYSYENVPISPQIFKTSQTSVVEEPIYSDSEFSQAVERVGIQKSFAILEELMETLAILNPNLYHSVIRKLNELN